MRLSLALLGILACLHVSAGASVSVTDDVGFSESFSRPPERVVSLSPGATEILFALDAGGKLVAVSEYCDYPEAARELPQVGDFANPSMEAILSWQPDLVVATGGPQRELILRLRSSKVPTLVLYPKDLEGVFGNVRLLGRVLGKDREAMRLDGRLRSRLATLKKTAAKLSAGRRPRVYFEVSPQPIMAAGEGSYPGQLIELAGGENVARGVQGSYPRLSVEKIIMADPEVIILSYCGDPGGPSRSVSERPGWGDLSAVKSGRIHADLEMDLLLRPGPRLLDGLERMINCLHAKR